MAAAAQGSSSGRPSDPHPRPAAAWPAGHPMGVPMGRPGMAAGGWLGGGVCGRPLQLRRAADVGGIGHLRPPAQLAWWQPWPQAPGCQLQPAAHRGRHDRQHRLRPRPVAVGWRLWLAPGTGAARRVATPGAAVVRTADATRRPEACVRGRSATATASGGRSPRYGSRTAAGTACAGRARRLPCPAPVPRSQADGYGHGSGGGCWPRQRPATVPRP